MSDQERLNAWVARRPLALAAISLVFMLLAVGLFVHEDPTGRRPTDSFFADYVLAPVTFLMGLAGLVVAAVRQRRRATGTVARR